MDAPQKHFNVLSISQTEGIKLNALTPILEYKRAEVASLKVSTSISQLSAEAKAQTPPRGFANALSKIASSGENALICELKRKSPSAGEILPGAEPVDIAREYETGGAACLSILTDGPSFGGTLCDLRAIKDAVSLPLLRKDFMVDPIQVIEARANGADAILIIMGAVDDRLAEELHSAAAQHEMDVLIEVHDEAELERALLLPSGLLGINNRDLTIMKTDLSVTERLGTLVPKDREFVSESGVKTVEDILRLRRAGAYRFLIGESLMLSNSRKSMVSDLKSSGTV